MKKLKYLVSASLIALGLGAQAGDFQGHLVEIRAGGSFPFGQHTVSEELVGQTNTNKIATRGPLGLAGLSYIYNMGDVLSKNVDLGVSLGANWLMGSSVLRVNTPNPAEHYSVAQQTRYELALRMGADHGKAYPFFKVGAVAGDWETKARTQFGRVEKKDLRWGATVGMGVDVNVHSQGALGFIVEFDWYASKSYDLLMPNGTFQGGKIDTKPWATNVAFTYKYKIA